jgi:hypothetical protein
MYVAYAATIFVWIPSTRLGGRPIQRCQLRTTRFGAMHSPSGSLLTPRANLCRPAGEALTESSRSLSSCPSSVVSLRTPSGRVGYPNALPRNSGLARLGFSNPREWASATTRVIPELPGFGSPGADLGCAFSCGSWNTCRANQRCRNMKFLGQPRERSMLRLTRAIQMLSCQRWAPEPRGASATGSEPAFRSESTCSPRRTRFGGRWVAFQHPSPNL